RPPQGAEGPAPSGSGDLSPTLAVRAPLAWLGPGKVIDRVSVVCDGGRIQWVGSARLAPQADDELEVEGFLMPGVADRHVHIGLADPGAVLLGGVTAVRDLAWPPDVIFPLADASELPAFNGPLIRAAGPILTAPGGYPTTDRWAPAGTGPVIEAAAKAMRIVSTLDIWSYGAVTAELRMAVDNMARFRAAGGTVVYGTDLGNGAIPPGIDVREVLLLRETVGMTSDEILEALVAGPLEPGAPADLIALARDPREDLTALGDLKLVTRAGRVVTAT